MLCYLLFLFCLGDEGFCPQPFCSNPQLEYSTIFTDRINTIGQGNYWVGTTFTDKYGSTWADSDGNKKDVFDYSHINLLLNIKYGISDCIDLGLEGGYTNIDDKGKEPRKTEGLSDLTINAKYIIPMNLSSILLAYNVKAILKTGTERDRNNLGASENYNALEQDVLALFPFTSSLDATLEGGFLLPLESTKNDYKGSLICNLTLGYTFCFFRPVIEARYSNEMGTSGKGGNNLSLGGGLNVTIRKSFLLQGGYMKDISGKNERLNSHCYIGFGYHFRTFNEVIIMRDLGQPLLYLTDKD